MAITVPRIISLLIALGWAVAFAIQAGGVTLQALVLWTMMFVFLGMIWVPRRFGLSAVWRVRSGPASDHVVEPPPPNWMVAGVGWLLLVVVPPMVFFLYLRQSGVTQPLVP